MSPFLGVSGLGGPGSLIGASLPGTNLSENYWVTKVEGSSINGYAVTVDDDGNVFFVGANAMTGTGDTGLIGKLNIDGSHAWSRAFTSNSSGTEYFSGVDVDSSGNVYAVGFCNNSSFTNGGEDMIIVKYDTDGNLQWQRSLGANTLERGYEIHIDSSDNIFVVGNTSQSGNTYILVAKYNTSGTLQWQNSFGDSTETYGYGITSDSSGNLYVCGPYFTTDRKTSVFKLNSSGTVQWARQITNPTSSGDVFGTNIAVDSSGNVYVCMSGEGSGHSSEWRIVKLDTSQNISWERNLNPSGSSEVFGIRIDSGGDVIVGGYANDGINIQLTVVKWNSSGTYQWANKVNTMNSSVTKRDTYTYDMEIDREDNVYLIGTTYSDGQGLNVAKMPGDESLNGSFKTAGFGYVEYSSATHSIVTGQSALTIASYTPTSVTPTLTNLTSSLTSSSISPTIETGTILP